MSKRIIRFFYECDFNVGSVYRLYHRYESCDPSSSVVRSLN